MSDAQILLLLASAHIAAAVTPGLNTLLVIKTAARSRRLALWTAAGFWPAGVAWAAAGMGGLGTLLAAFPGLALVFRLSCGAYITYLGIKMVQSSLQTPTSPAIAPSSGTQSSRSALFQGFLTNATNPKSIAYFLSIFGAVEANRLPPSLQAVAVLGLPTIGFAWYALLALAISNPWVARGYLGAQVLIERCAGALIAGLGVRMLTSFT